MVIYVLLIFLLLYGLFLSRMMMRVDYKMAYREVFVNQNVYVLLFWFLAFLVLAVFRGVEVGTDYPMYYYFFIDQSFVYHDIESGVSFFYKLALSAGNFLIFPFCVYSLFLLLMFIGIKRNTPNYLISILLFVLTFNYFTSFNQLRQMLALSFVFCFIQYLLSDQKRDKLKFLLVILVATFFHRSAIFLLLMFIIPYRKKFAKNIVIPLFITTIIIYFLPGLKNILGELIIHIASFYSDKYEENLLRFFETSKEKGIIQIMPVVIQMIIVTLSLTKMKVKENLQINMKLFYFSTNMVMIYLCLFALSGIEAVDRLQVYFNAFNIYFYAILIHILMNSEKRRNGQIAIICICGFWMAYYLLRLLINTQGIVPYSLI